MPGGESFARPSACGAGGLVAWNGPLICSTLAYCCLLHLTFFMSVSHCLLVGVFELTASRQEEDDNWAETMDALSTAEQVGGRDGRQEKKTSSYLQFYT